MTAGTTAIAKRLEPEVLKAIMYARETWHDEPFQKWADAWIQNTDRTAAAADAEEVRIRETAGNPDPHNHAFAMKAIELIMQGKEHDELSELAFAGISRRGASSAHAVGPSSLPRRQGAGL